MKRSACACLTVIILLLAPGRLLAQGAASTLERSHNDLSDPTFQLVFLSVLEGCFQDGLTDTDVNQILLKSPKHAYEHFIYACPICSATIYALEAYRARPDAHMLKPGNTRLSFGGGLTSEMHARLFSVDVRERLSIIHDLEQNWVDQRVTSLRLDADEAAQIQKGLKSARDEGARLLQAFVQQGQLDQFAPAYHKGDECAVCDAATGMSLKLAPGN